jgi:hypothetical protein
MLDLSRRLPAASTEHARRLIEMYVEATDYEIDRLVYDLYDLTPDEIAVVEAGVGGQRSEGDRIGAPSVAATLRPAGRTAPAPAPCGNLHRGESPIQKQGAPCASGR